jgi:hypothetical protein
MNNQLINICKPIPNFTKQWTVAYINDYIFLPPTEESEIEYQMLRLSITTIKKELNPEKIYIYTYHYENNHQILAKLGIEFNVSVVQIPPNWAQYAVIIIMENLLQQKKNFIIANSRTFCASSQGINIRTRLDEIDSIFGMIRPINLSDPNYLAIYNKFCFNYIVNSNLLIVPANQCNLDFILKVYDVGRQFCTTDYHFVTDISMTLINLKNNAISEITEDPILSKIFYDHNSKSLYAVIRELQYEYPNCNINWNVILELYPFQNLSSIDNFVTVPFKNLYAIYDNPNYLFYPVLDVCGNLMKITPEEIPITDIFNTNGFSPANKHKLLSGYMLSMFKRFSTRSDGVFIRKNIPLVPEIIDIPTIIHHIWLYPIGPVLNYVNPWRRILRPPWTYRLWTLDDLRRELFTIPGTDQPSKWGTLFDCETSLTIKLIIAEMAIIEAFGGVIIDGLYLPLRFVTDDLLLSKLIISFMDEANYGTQLNYRFMISSKNNPIANVIYQIITDGIGKSVITLQLINDAFILSPDATIYPSYYFNPLSTGLPRSLLRLSVALPIWPKPQNQVITINSLANPPNSPALPTIPQSMTTIVSDLNENPRDRIRNFGNLRNQII